MWVIVSKDASLPQPRRDTVGIRPRFLQVPSPPGAASVVRFLSRPFDLGLQELLSRGAGSKAPCTIGLSCCYVLPLVRPSSDNPSGDGGGHSEHVLTGTQTLCALQHVIEKWGSDAPVTLFYSSVATLLCFSSSFPRTGLSLKYLNLIHI